MSKPARSTKKENKAKKTLGKSSPTALKSAKKATDSKTRGTVTGKKTSEKKSTDKETSKKKTSSKMGEKAKPGERPRGKEDDYILKELQAEIQSDDEQVALGAVERLSQLRDSRATEILIQGLHDRRQMMRIHVAAQLGERKDPRAVDALIASLDDKSVFVRQTVAGALENIGGAKAKKAVKKIEEEGLLLDELPEGRRLTD